MPRVGYLCIELGSDKGTGTPRAVEGRSRVRKSVDDETYGEKGSSDPKTIRNGNPGVPQSDFESDEVEADVAPVESISDARQPGEGPIPEGDPARGSWTRHRDEDDSTGLD